MLDTLKLLVTLAKDRRGVTAVEYAVVAAGLIAVAATAFSSLGTRLSTKIGAIIGA
jgi:Flp pilus assembly pilin Flp